ncbi:MAG: GTPase ObgE [Candidatus Omnitrophica bacterium]|nr:GTPase ObgE [Candidatus Omnitrophota bacterium]MBU1996717.1 GTPase ObgE [Candidatus Omnitrophota bacterium]MBU4334838.1 GTPase ObgE [Candidatus Omnitrophota bacterium]
MIFIDEARIFLKAGDGGKGCESFYRDKYMRHPIPDGGDGGKGGNVVFVASRSVQTLLDFKFRQHHKAKKGGNASSNSKKGKIGENCILRVPMGTIIKDAETGLLIRDLVEDGQLIIVAKGGEGGIGNGQKKPSKPPCKGEEKTISLELKLIADVGIVGFPNAGKSTIISNISKVRSKIASYPFTTKQPILGIVENDEDGSSFIIADLPGIIEGAHQGKGIGDRFLRHAERTRILVHAIDMAAEDQRDPLEDYEKLNHELREFSDLLSFKKRILVANKIDLPGAQENLDRFKKKFKDKIFVISALNNVGLDELVREIRDSLCLENSQEKSEE